MERQQRTKKILVMEGNKTDPLEEVLKLRKEFPDSEFVISKGCYSCLTKLCHNIKMGHTFLFLHWNPLTIEGNIIIPETDIRLLPRVDEMLPVAYTLFQIEAADFCYKKPKSKKIAKTFYLLLPWEEKKCIKKLNLE